MAVQSSGAISLSDLAEEFGDTQPYSMSEYYRDGGKVPGVNTNVPASGLIRMQNFYGSVNELLQAVTANASINAQTIFGSDWGTNIPKRLSIPAGVTIGPLTIPSGMGGTLEVDVAGNIYGTGGSANGGAGGHAITSNTSFTLNVLSGGSVRGGGGGGGQGGTGGGGTYTVPAGSWSAYQHGQQGGQWRWGWQANIRADSPSGSGQAPSGSQSRTYVTWDNSLVVPLNTFFDSAVKIAYNRGGYDYERGAWQGGTGDNLYAHTHKVRRRTSASSANSNGGSGGSGGRGQGYNQSLASGSGGSAGGTNAGTGGTGGSGGNWGAGGATGATGANGNRTNGSGGSGGGAAGRAVLMNAGTVTVNNSGTINGAY